MKIRAKETIMAVLISIPIIVAKVNSDKPDETVRPVDVANIEIETETVIETEQLYLVPCYDYSFIVPYEPQFEGYDFIPLPTEEQVAIKEVCDKYNLAYELMMSIAKQESCFDKTAHNPISDDYGLFQINETTWNDVAVGMGLSDYKTDFLQNTEMACYIVRECLTMANGDLRIALNYYRTGTQNNKYEAGSDYASIILENINEMEKLKDDNYGF